MVKYRLDPKNARIHPERNRDAIGKSLRELGAGRSIVVDKDGVVIGGNCVYKKALELGLETKVVHTSGDKLVVVVRDDLATGDPRRKALALADNQIALLAEWDEVRLEEILGELGDIDLDVMGFEKTNGTIQEPQNPATLVDRAEELQKKWKVKRGQIWEIPGKAGIHRVMCGDSTDAENMALLMDGERAGMWLTDPPYGVGYEYASHNDSDIDAYKRLCQGFMERALSLGCFGVVTIGYANSNWWFAEFQPDSYLIWFDPTKQSPHKVAYLCKSELILTFGKPVGRYAWDTFEVQGVRGDGLRELHTCPKPIELYVKLIEPQVKRGGIVVDFFLGSGTTVVAAEQEGHICYGMEIEPKYVAVTLERLSALGLKPVMSDG